MTVTKQLGSFTDDARTAMQASPNYFIKWHRVNRIFTLSDADL
jgi:hypothetical protein